MRPPNHIDHIVRHPLHDLCTPAQHQGVKLLWLYPVAQTAASSLNGNFEAKALQRSQNLATDSVHLVAEPCSMS